MSLLKSITKIVSTVLVLTLLGYSSIASARFLSADPMGVNEHVQRYQDNLRRPAASTWHPPLEINPYAAVANNPLRWVDPFGLDITISFNPNAAAGFGHVGIGVNTPNTVGQRPQPGASNIQTGLGLNVPGVISVDPAAPSNITIQTTPEQDRKAQQCIDTRAKQKQDYNLYNNNCTQFARQCLGAAGINTPNTIFPRALFKNLQQNLGGNP